MCNQVLQGVFSAFLVTYIMLLDIPGNVLLMLGNLVSTESQHLLTGYFLPVLPLRITILGITEVCFVGLIQNVFADKRRHGCPLM